MKLNPFLRDSFVGVGPEIIQVLGNECVKNEYVCKFTGQIRINSFSANGKIEVFANNTDSGELSYLKSALFAF